MFNASLSFQRMYNLMFLWVIWPSFLLQSAGEKDLWKNPHRYGNSSHHSYGPQEVSLTIRGSVNNSTQLINNTENALQINGTTGSKRKRPLYSVPINPAVLFISPPLLEENEECTDTQIYDHKSNKCREKLLLNMDDSQRSSNRSSCIPKNNYRNNDITHGNTSTVFIRKAGEVMELKDYLLSGSGNDNGTVYVCDKFINCKQKLYPLTESEFLMFQNESILHKHLGVLYGKSLYLWQDGRLYVCDDRSPGQTRNCLGMWASVESHEFSVLNGTLVYVIGSKTLYNLSQYLWSNGSLYICVPNHLTLTTINKQDALSIVSIICMSMSIIALVFVLVTYSLFSELRTPPGINIMNLSVAILLSQFLWLVGSGQTDHPVACTAIAVLLHYFFLVSFVWTSIIAFDTWGAFTAKGGHPAEKKKRKRMLRSLAFMAIGWLPSMVYIAICVVLDQSHTVLIGYGSHVACWITNAHAKWIFFAVPLGLIIVFNGVFFVLTVNVIRKTRRESKLAANSPNRGEFGIYVRIASLMGFTWIFGFLAPLGWVFLWYVYVILSSLQGVYIAIAFSLSKRARNLYKQWLQSRSPKKNKLILREESQLRVYGRSSFGARNAKTEVTTVEMSSG